MTHHFLPDGSQAYVFTGRITRQRAELRVRGGSVSGTLDLDLAGDTGETAHFEMPLVTNLALPGDVDDYTVEGHLVDEFPVDDNNSVTLHLADASGNGGCKITMTYNGRTGCWDATVGLLGEGIPIPWPVTVHGDRYTGGKEREDFYTVRVDVDCPDDVAVQTL